MRTPSTHPPPPSPTPPPGPALAHRTLHSTSCFAKPFTYNRSPTWHKPWLLCRRLTLKAPLPNATEKPPASSKGQPEEEHDAVLK